MFFFSFSGVFIAVYAIIVGKENEDVGAVINLISDGAVIVGINGCNKSIVCFFIFAFVFV